MWFVGQSTYRFKLHETLLTSEASSVSQDTWNEEWDKRGFFSQLDISPDGVIVQRDQDPIVPEGRKIQETFVFKRMDVPIPETDSTTRILDVSGLVTVLSSHVERDKKLERAREAGYMVWFFDETDKAARYLTVAPLPARSVEQYQAGKMFYLPGNIRSIALVLFLRDSNAVLALNSAEVSIVEERVGFKIARYLLICVYAIAVISFLVFLLAQATLPTILGSIFLVGITLLAIVIPDQIRNSYTLGIQELILKVRFLSDLGFDGKTLLFKGGHFVAFLVLTLWMMLLGKRKGLSNICVVSVLLLFAASTEVIQVFRFDRESRISDLLIDISGLLVGLILIVLASQITNLRKTTFIPNQSD